VLALGKVTGTAGRLPGVYTEVFRSADCLLCKVGQCALEVVPPCILPRKSPLLNIVVWLYPSRNWDTELHTQQNRYLSLAKPKSQLPTWASKKH